MAEKTLLIIDDDVDICILLERYFKRKGFQVKKAFNGKNGLKIIQEGEIDLVLTDFRLPDIEGFDVIQSVKQLNSSIPVIVITGYSDVNQAVKAIQLGAYEYVTKPIYPEEILSLVNQALQNNDITTKEKNVEEVAPSTPLVEDDPFEAFLVPNSPYSQQLQEQISLVAPTNVSCVIIGETGTGKEVVARMIHKASKRRNRPFIPIDCGALTQELAASELFGHVKGAFTGAATDKKGSFELAHNGTLFLDEIGNLSYENQVKLLRVLQERKIRRVGGEKEISINVRIIVATNEDLKILVQNKSFREDVYFRINEFRINLLPLRENHEELIDFIPFFIQKSNQTLSKSVKSIDEEVKSFFLSYAWPGNIRELKNVINYAVLVAKDDTLHLRDLPEDLISNNHNNSNNSTPLNVSSFEPGSLLLKDVTALAESKAIQKALELANQNKTKAAELLGIDRKTLYNKLNAYGLIEDEKK